ncbi:hypothetical protein RJP21_21680 [Paenibacillus sp. VCA1]|uniref:hypothetical protein n=1 Tax=Paenibacillus sp. VCA1 TaxID=3039148 RepID=UPI0028722A71|nr:hypothetical protein [Paenibacillus sp. VCA1]MDR9856217.1 hypothetical protein [Paenibacillus sp. VCA1]
MSGLAGLEQVLLFSAVFLKTQNMTMNGVDINVPSYIWGITKYTFAGGIISIVAAIIIFLVMIMKNKKWGG